MVFRHLSESLFFRAHLTFKFMRPRIWNQNNICIWNWNIIFAKVFYTLYRVCSLKSALYTFSHFLTQNIQKMDPLFKWMVCKLRKILKLHVNGAALCIKMLIKSNLKTISLLNKRSITVLDPLEKSVSFSWKKLRQKFYSFKFGRIFERWVLAAPWHIPNARISDPELVYFLCRSLENREH